MSKICLIQLLFLLYRCSAPDLMFDCLTTAMPGTIWWMFFFQQRILLWLLLYYCNSFYSPSRIIPVSIYVLSSTYCFCCLVFTIAEIFHNVHFESRFRLHFDSFSQCSFIFAMLNWLLSHCSDREPLCHNCPHGISTIAQCVIIYSIYTTKKCILKIL